MSQQDARINATTTQRSAALWGCPRHCGAHLLKPANSQGLAIMNSWFVPAHTGVSWLKLRGAIGVSVSVGHVSAGRAPLSLSLRNPSLTL